MILVSGKDIMKVESFMLGTAIFIAGAITGFLLAAASHAEMNLVQASTLSIEDPPMQGHQLNLSRDEMDRDLTIDPDANFTGTQELPTEGATDIDINQIPPAGVSIIISNETVVVTKEPVTVG